tara:strand:- start:660 stop:1214 length:555 start_codon:yes stop_codon:yes gene_type:complete
MTFLKGINKMFKSKNGGNVLVILAIVAVVYIVMDYERIKSSLGLDSMNNMKSDKQETKQVSNNYKPSEADQPTEGNVNGLNTDMQNLPPSCASKQISNPKDLLPADGNSEFSKMNPSGAGDLMNVNLLRAGHHIGINTVGTSLRNANLQVRSEPPNPRLNTGPWNTSTITSDGHRRPLEIGSRA